MMGDPAVITLNRPLQTLLISVVVLASMLATTILSSFRNNQDSNNIAGAQIYLAARKDKKNPHFASPSPTPSPAPSTSPSPSPSPSSVPVTRPIKVGIVVNDYANRYGELSSLEAILGKSISTVSIYKQFGSKYNSNLVLDDLSYIKSKGMKLLLAWEPWNPEQGMNQSVDYLQAITQGQQDTYIRSFANSVKTYGSPVTIRFGHEMNGNWYPWGNKPTQYITSYRHVVDIFRQEGVTNVTWMWSINFENTPYSPISNVSSYYPGDDVVDAIGIDGYNWGSSQSWSTWKSFKDIFIPSYNFLTSTYFKPLVVAETASTELGGNKPLWIEEMFKDSLTNSFTKITEVVWFNILKETDWRINSTDASLQSFKTNMP